MSHRRRLQKPKTFAANKPDADIQEMVEAKKLLEGNKPKENKVIAGAIPFDYNPDAEFDDKNFLITRDELVQRSHIPLNAEIDLNLYDPKTQQNVRITEADALINHHNKVKESFPDDFSINQLTGNVQGNEYVPLVGGPWSKQLYIYDMLQMQIKAFEMRNHNPIARAIVNVTTDYTIGKGIQWHIEDDTVKAYWEAWWKRYNMSAKLKQYSDDGCTQGELFLRYRPDPFNNKYLKPFVVDPSTVWEIVTDPEDIDLVYYYHRQFPTQYQIFTFADIPSMKYIIDQIPAPDMYHLKLNVSTVEKRGRSDFYPAMTWLKRCNDYYNALTLKAVMQSNITFHLTVKGDDSQVSAVAASFAPLLNSPGNVTYTNADGDNNPNVKIDVTEASQTATNPGTVGLELVAMVGAAVNIPPEFLAPGLSNAAVQSRASALVKTEPFVKKIEKRQSELNDMLKDMYERVISFGIMQNDLPANASTDVDFIFPSVVADDRSALVKDLQIGFMDKIMSHEQYSNRYAAAIGIDKYNYHDEQDKIHAEELANPSVDTALGNLYKTDIKGSQGAALKPGEEAPATTNRQDMKKDVQK